PVLLLLALPPLPLLSPPFPYTTLFRSVDAGPAHYGPAPDAPSRGRAPDPGPPAPVHTRSVERPTAGAGAAAHTPAPRPRPATGSDRQSTRLNSSHVKTSYAAFCLKNQT